MRNQYRILTVFMGGLLIIGCQPMATTATNIPKKVRTIDASHPRAKLVLGSEKLLRKIGVGDPRFRSVGQLTQAQVKVQNLTETRYILEYNFTWENDQGFNVSNINAWHSFTLTPRESRTFTSTGKVPDATNIVFTIRLPNNIFQQDQQKTRQKK